MKQWGIQTWTLHPYDFKTWEEDEDRVLRDIDTGDTDSEYDEVEAAIEEFSSYVFGSSVSRTMTLNMAGGGSHWYNFVVHFDGDGEQTQVTREDTDGVHALEGTLYISMETDYRQERVMLMSEWGFEQLPEWFTEWFVKLYIPDSE